MIPEAQLLFSYLNVAVKLELCSTPTVTQAAAIQLCVEIFLA